MKSSKHLLHHYNIHSCGMYKKSEHLLPFYSPIEETPQAQICHLDMHLRKSDPVFFFLFSFYELMSAAWVSFFLLPFCKQYLQS